MAQIGVLQKAPETAQKGDQVQVADFNGTKIFVQPASKVYIESEALGALMSDFSHRIAETSGFLVGHKDSEGDIYLTHYQKMTGIIRRLAAIDGFSESNIENNLANLERSYPGNNVLLEVHLHDGDAGEMDMYCAAIRVGYDGLSASMNEADDAVAVTFSKISKKHGFNTVLSGFVETGRDKHTKSPVFLLNLFDYSDLKEKKPIGYSLDADPAHTQKHGLKASFRNGIAALVRHKEDFFALHRKSNLIEYLKKLEAEKKSCKGN